MRFVAVAVVLALAAASAALAVMNLGPPSETDLLESSGIAGKRELLVGVRMDQPGISALDPATRQFGGFDIEIAKLVAGELHFPPERVRFLAIEGEDRARMHASDDNGRTVKVDLVVATYSMTKQREEKAEVSFAGPYLVTERSVVTRVGHPPVESLSGLRGRSVCTLGTSTSEGALAEAGANIVLRLKISECVQALLRDEVEAVSLDSAILAGFVAQDPEHLMNHDIASEEDERWGINTGGSEPLRTLVNLALERSRLCASDRRWENAFNTYLRPSERYIRTQAVAEDTQPKVERPPKVREWPWQRNECS